MSRTELHQLRDVFTPNKPARLTFVERKAINDTLVNALRTPGKQVVVYGHSGSGKTTVLVNKLEQLYERHITTRCVRHLTLEHLVLDAFDQLDPYYKDGGTISSKLSLKTSIGAEYKALKVQVEKAKEEQKTSSVKRFIPPTLTPQTLARLMGPPEVCWVLEDFHKLGDDEKRKLAQVMKVFMDEGDQHTYLKIVAIGAVDTARQVVEADAEMRHRVAEIHVPLMTDDEIRQIITRGEELLNFRLSATVREGIVAYTNGVASVCHELCLKICQAIGLVETLEIEVEASEKHLEVAVQEYLREMEDTVKADFDRALRRHGRGKFDNTEFILHSLAQSPQEGVTEDDLLSGLRKRQPGYRAATLRKLLAELQTDHRGSILRLDQASGRFSFRDPIYRTVAKLRAEKVGPSVASERQARLLRLEQLTRLLMAELGSRVDSE